MNGFADIVTRLHGESGGTIKLRPLAVLAEDDNLIAQARGDHPASRQEPGHRELLRHSVHRRQGRPRSGLRPDPDQVDDFWAWPMASRSSRAPGRLTERRTS